MAHWMERYTCPDRLAPRDRVYECVGYGVVTDARSLLAVRGVDANPFERPETARVEKAILNLLTVPCPDDAPVTTLGDLWAWLDRVERAKCPECGGTKSLDTFHGDLSDPYRLVACYFCDGDGWLFPEPQPYDADVVFIAGAPLDRNRVAWWLAGELGEPTDAARYWRHKGYPTKSNPDSMLVVFEGATWRFVTGGFADDKGAYFTDKSYRTYTPGAGQWYETRRQFAPAAHPGTDWFIEHAGYDPTDLVKMWGTT